MTTFTFSGTNTNFFRDAFFYFYDGLNLDLISATTTQVVVRNPPTEITPTMTGTNITFDDEGEPSGGTITSLEIVDQNSIVQGSITGISWSFEAYIAGLDEIDFTGDLRPLADLFNSNGPITVDASNAGLSLIHI